MSSFIHCYRIVCIYDAVVVVYSCRRHSYQCDVIILSSWSGPSPPLKDISTRRGEVSAK